MRPGSTTQHRCRHRHTVNSSGRVCASRPADPSTLLQARETNKFHLSWTALLLTVGGTCVLTPIAEEWIFRGFLQPLLIRRWGAVAGIVSTAALFTLTHRWSIHILLAVGAFALLQGYVAYRRKSLTYLILMHAAFNLTAMWPQILRSLVYLKVL